MQAYSQHFLTDMFASGHVRTPRKIFPQQCAPDDTGDYLSRYQHDEECHYGLNVSNSKGEQWVAYGDEKYLDSANAENRARAAATVQASVDEVVAAFENGSFQPDSSNFAAAEMVPSEVDEKTSLSPMFKWNVTEKMLYRRKDINDLRETEYIKQAYIGGWSSVTTLIELEALYGPPSGLPPKANANYGPQRFSPSGMSYGF